MGSWLPVRVLWAPEQEFPMHLYLGAVSLGWGLSQQGLKLRDSVPTIRDGSPGSSLG